MSLDYIRRVYNVPARRGGRVEWTTLGARRSGTITKGTHYVYVLFDDAKHAVPLHPTDEGLKYLDAENRKR